MRTASNEQRLVIALPEVAAQPDAGARPMTLLLAATVREYRKQLRSGAHAVRAGEDPEAVHDVRVATRAFRAALDVFVEAGMLKPGAVRPTRTRLKRLARALGRVRDLDVMAESAADYIAANAGAAAALDGWLAHLRQRRRKAHQRLLLVLRASPYQHLMRDLRRLERCQKVVTAASPPLLERHCAGGAIWRRYEAVRALAEQSPERSPESLHELRIACKRLRYVVGLFADALGQRATPIQETLVRSQKLLGSAHDASARLTALRRYYRKHAGSAGLRTYIEAEMRHIDALWAEVAPLRIELGSEPLRQALAAALAGL